MADEVIAPLRKRVLDLYKRGKEVPFTDDEGEFKIWVSKTTPKQDKIAYQNSRPVRASLMALKKDKNNPERLQFLEVIEELSLDSREVQTLFLAGPKVQEAQLSIEARVAEEDLWAKDDYLLSLQEAWNDGLKEKWALDNDDVDASRVYAQLKKYTQQVLDELEDEREDIIESFDIYSDDEIESKVIDRLIEAEADGMQINELRAWQLFFACRMPDSHNEFFFESRDQLDEIDPVVYRKLRDAYEEVSVDTFEGKE